MWKKQPITANPKCTLFPGQADWKCRKGVFEQRPERYRNLKTSLSDFISKNFLKPQAQIGSSKGATHKQRTGRN